MNQPENKQIVTTRLRHDIYVSLERKLSKLIVNEATTVLQAGYALGIEAALKEIRNGYSAEHPASN